MYPWWLRKYVILRFYALSLEPEGAILSHPFSDLQLYPQSAGHRKE
jgi:hypothetical protein